MVSTTINCPSQQASVEERFTEAMRLARQYWLTKRVTYFAQCLILAVLMVGFGFAMMFLAAVIGG